MLSRFRSQSLPSQLAAGALIVIVLIFSVLIVAIELLFEKQLSEIVTDHQKVEVNLIAKQLEAEYRSITHQTSVLSDVFVDQLAGGLKVDPSKSVKIKSIDSPQMTFNGDTVNLNFDIVDRFTAATDASATIFVRHGDDFLRVSTSLKDQQGQRAIGTYLGKNHPGYQALLNGQPFVGKAFLFGKNYITQYTPVVQSGKTIAILYIGLGYDEILKGIKTAIGQLTFGKSGYAYVTDTGQNEGQLLVHPTLTERNIYQEFPEVRSDFEKMYQSDSGVIHYTIQVAGKDQTAQESKAIFQRVNGWDWVVAIKAYSAEYQQEIMSILLFVIAICTAAALLLAATLWFYIRSSLRPLRDIAHGVKEIGEGNLTYRFSDYVSAQSKNETHRLQRSIQSMRDGLLELIEAIQSSSQQLLSSAQTITQANERLIGSATSSSNSCAQVAAAVEQMSASIEEVAQSSTEVSETTVSVNASTEQGHQATKAVETTVANLAASFENAAKTIQEVEHSTENIGNVVNVINEIAEQTNLLALNAAIEAARAGEQGRGFAVVADEVRVLAQRTQQSTEEIKQVVERLQKGSRSAVDTMQQGRDQVTNSVDQATHAGELLSSINHAMGTVSIGISNVAASTEEQSVAATQIRGNAEELHVVANQTFEEAQSSLNESQRINQLAEELQRKLTRFSL
ncbi:Methyl-accepting chemotaxis protein PctB [Marinomonas aquimarina]|uniref:Methyl-accepting chemotaxis protein PctB n=1 Tax=Marinomonas aquimarina TaxID=295068 RepID=A0A1A8T7G1_9GAMM|nr:methyl-accepting chemotaxis protein [Marinomonas aquimarina]SBS28190.1 Methyl-accepting chemotaxis protein PctB [Marinomonas aquimarina]